MSGKIGVVGAGLVGRGWAIAFARGGYSVALWDGAPTAVTDALSTIQARLDDLQQSGLVDDPEAVCARITPAGTLAEAVDGAAYVQENVAETVDAKREIFARLDTLTPPETVLASSTSGIPASAFTAELAHRERCLVAHPANPPYLLPIVELCGAPWTDPKTLARAAEILTAVGQEPVVIRKEIRGFVLNRLQGALLNEAFRLVEEGYVTPDDLDKTVRHGLGLRWSFMGPFETIDLNAPNGLREFCERYGPIFQDVRGQPPPAEPWDETLLAALQADRRAAVPLERHPERQAWRDHRLTALAAHKRAMEDAETEP